MTNINIKIPEDVWYRFKKIVPHSISLKDQVATLIMSFIKENESTNGN